MDPAELDEALRIARAAERMGYLSSGDWPDVAVALLLEGAEDPEIAELAGFDKSVSAWTPGPLIESVWERRVVAAPATMMAPSRCSPG